eukprot:scaffold7909_cov115-Skeletonema_dohrnii-CCMP3373.AAC.4
MLISSKAVNHEAAGGLSVVAVSVGRKLGQSSQKRGAEVYLNVLHGKGEGGKMQLKKNDFEKFGRFEMKQVLLGRVIRTSPYWYEKSKEISRKRKETRTSWQNDPMHAKARNR